MSTLCSFPFDGGRGLGGDVIDHAVDPADLVNDAARNASKNIVRKFRPIGGHGVDTLDAADANGLFVGSGIAHDAHRTHREEHREPLPQGTVDVAAQE